MIYTLARTVRNGALLLWVTLLPLQTRYFLHRGELAGGFWEYGTLSLYLTDMLLLVGLIAAFMEGDTFWRVPKRLPTSVLVVAISVLIASLISAIAAQDVGLALGHWLRLSLGFLAFLMIVKSDLSMVWLAIAVVTSAGIEAFVAVAQSATQSIPASTSLGLSAHQPSVAGDAVIETANSRFLRAYGTLPYPNIAAGWFVLGLILSAGLYLRSHEKLVRAVILVVFLLMSAGLFLTFSRSALVTWLLLLLLLTFASLLRDQRDRHWFGHLGFRSHDLPLGLKALKLVVSTILIFGVFSFLYAPFVTTRTSALGRLEDKSIQERFTQLSEAKKLFFQHWLFGVGTGNYTKALYAAVSSRHSSEYQPVHNTFILMAVELGSLGSLIILWAMLSTVVTAWRKHRQLWQQDHRGVPWVAITSLCLMAVLAIGLVDHYLWSLPFGIMFFWLIYALWAKSLGLREPHT